jgi:hypothetical protein
VSNGSISGSRRSAGAKGVTKSRRPLNGRVGCHRLGGRELVGSGLGAQEQSVRRRSDAHVRHSAGLHDAEVRSDALVLRRGRLDMRRANCWTSESQRHSRCRRWKRHRCFGATTLGTSTCLNPDSSRRTRIIATRRTARCRGASPCRLVVATACPSPGVLWWLLIESLLPVGEGESSLAVSIPPASETDLGFSSDFYKGEAHTVHRLVLAFSYRLGPHWRHD